MKIIPNWSLSLILLLAGIANVFAAPPTPVPPPPPQIPIDKGVLALFAIATLYGIYTIYNYKRKAKTSI